MIFSPPLTLTLSPPRGEGKAVLCRLRTFGVGRDAALRRPRPERSGGRNERGKTHVLGGSFRPLTLRSAPGTAQRAVPTSFYAIDYERHNPVEKRSPLVHRPLLRYSPRP